MTHLIEWNEKIKDWFRLWLGITLLSEKPLEQKLREKPYWKSLKIE